MYRVLQIARPLTGHSIKLQFSVINFQTAQKTNVKLFSSFVQPKKQSNCSNFQTLIVNQKISSRQILLQPSSIAASSQFGIRWISSVQDSSDTATTPSVSSEELVISIPEDLASTLPDVMAEPTFQSLGLAHAYPSGMFQALMEQFHVHLGLPWWGTIILTTVLMRMVLFPVVIKAQKNMVALNNVLPESQRRQMQTMDSNLSVDERLRARREYKQFMAENNIHPVLTYLPMICQASVFMSMFFALRGMANCPVESMKTGGLFWFTDLTLQDPFFALPVITCGSIFLHLHMGADGVDMGSMQKTIRRILLVMPLISLPIMCQFPAAMNVYWLTTNIISMSQSRILRIKPIREKFGIGELKKWKDTDLPMNQMSLFSPTDTKSPTNQMGQQFGPYDWKIREAEQRLKAKRIREREEQEKRDSQN